MEKLKVDDETWIVKLKFIYKFKSDGRIPAFVDLKHLERQLQYSHSQWATFLGREERMGY
ncbi:MAG: hypothetical protein V3U54_13200 [Thermodesulfobacteriota bacterium]